MLFRLASSVLLGLILGAQSFAQAVTTPKQFLGFDVCEDFQLANYKQLEAYWGLLAEESPRIRLANIGKTEEGRTQWMAIVTDPENHRNLGQIKEMNRKIALAKNLSSDADAIRLAKKSKAVIWIDGGLHSNETISTQSLIEMAYQLTSRNDAETKRILKDCVILLVHANPDGMDLVSNWYMRKKNPQDRSLAGVPRLYQKYAGHDNNRDFYAMNLAETRNMNRVLYQEWFPQVVYNHHQSSPAGTIMFIPPFRNPFNYHVDPLVQVSTDLVGILMHQRLIAEGKEGTVMRGGASFSSWWNGGLRTTTYFHNMVGILTELWGSPNPRPIPFLAERQIPSIDLPKPATAGLWHARQSLGYEITANYALLDHASRTRETLLFNFYRAGKNSIERGLKDHWTRYPARITELGEKALSNPALRDARAYVLPANQPDFPTAAKFIERLQQTGIEVDQLVEDQNGYPKGSFVVRTAQAFRPHILDMFEAQDHPNDLQYPGGPPIRPYDNAGYTLAYQMGVKFDRILDEIPLRTRPVVDTPVKVVVEGKSGGFWISATQNDGYALANAAVAQGLGAFRTTSRVGEFPAGSFYFPATTPMSFFQSQRSGFVVRSAIEPNDKIPHRRLKIGLWDVYGGSMDSGWLRLTLERGGFDFRVVMANELNQSGLREKFDVLLFPDGAIPARINADPELNPMAEDRTIPLDLRILMEELDLPRAVANLKDFESSGGRIVAIGGAGLNLAGHLGLGISSGLVTETDGKTVALKNTEFYVPGSVLRMRLDLTSPLTLGYTEEFLDVMFDNSPVFRSTTPNVRRVGWFDTAKPLRSGWAWGQAYLKDKAAILDITTKGGRVILFGPEVNFRAQPDGAFKLLFNAIGP